MSELNAQKQIVGDRQTCYNKVVDGIKPVLQVVPTRLIQAFYNKLLRPRACHQLVNDFSTILYSLVSTTCNKSVGLIDIRKLKIYSAAAQRRGFKTRSIFIQDNNCE